MLVIRLQRTGRRNSAAFRIVVAEKAAPIKGRSVEVVGHYIPTRDPVVFECNTERVSYWISQGAQPTDTVARLLKDSDVKSLETYIKAYTKKRAKKESPEEEAAPPPPAAEASGDDGAGPGPDTGSESAESGDDGASESEDTTENESESTDSQPEAEEAPAEEPKEESPDPESAPEPGPDSVEENVEEPAETSNEEEGDTEGKAA